MQKGFKEVNLHGCTSGVLPVPVIGESGNWFIGNDDTGVQARGDQGITGAKGDKGEQGEAGPMGPQGPKGEQGVPGIMGAQGEKGEKGDKGDKGANGEAGPMGPQGPKGEQGIQGPQGEAGPQGPKGEDADIVELERLSSEVDELNQSLNLGIDSDVKLPYTPSQDGFLSYYIVPSIGGNATSYYRITDGINYFSYTSEQGKAYSGMHIAKKGINYREAVKENASNVKIFFTPLFAK